MSGKLDTRGTSQDAGREGENRATEDGSTDQRAAPTRYLVSELMKGRREVILEHRGQDYRLRITEAGKLILSK
jgi:hemin uptake protein HemP